MTTSLGLSADHNNNGSTECEPCPAESNCNSDVIAIHAVWLINDTADYDLNRSFKVFDIASNKASCSDANEVHLKWVSLLHRLTEREGETRHEADSGCRLSANVASCKR